MASSKLVVLLAVVAAVACLASLASATQWMVGDAGGWRPKFNETGWANDKMFLVGDSLMFMYAKENHTVVQVGKEDFAACNLQGNQLGAWYTGADVVPLVKPGKVWFICTKPNHCLGGMKLVIDVVDPGTVAPGPLPPLPGLPLPPLPGLPLPPRPAHSPFFPFPGVPAPAPSPFFRVPPFPSSGGSSAPATPPASPPSAAVRNPIGGAVVAVAAAVIAAALAF